MTFEEEQAHLAPVIDFSIPLSTKGSLDKWLILPLGLRNFKMTLEHLVQENKEVLTEWLGCVKRTRSQIVRAPIGQMCNIKIK